MTGRRMKSYGGGVETCCLICLEPVLSSEGGSRKPFKISSAFGSNSTNAFIKICELLQVSFLEIQDDWRFEEEDDMGEEATSGKILPFCALCLSGLHSVIKLRKQLVEIQKKIDDKMQKIREQIMESSSSSTLSDIKVITFRSKALANSLSGTGNYGIVSHNGTSTINPAITNLGASSPRKRATFSATQIEFPVQTAENESVISTHTTTTMGTSNQNNYFSFNYQDSHNTEDGGYDDDNNFHCDSPSYSNVENDEINEEATRFKTNAPFTTISAPSNKNRRQTHVTTRLEKGESRQPEHFSPITTDNMGRMFYEGILITPLEEGYQCGICCAQVGKDHSSVAQRKIKIHIKGYHLGAYKCSTCDKNFTSYDILYQHITRVHENSDSGPCPICLRPVKAQNLNVHLLSHMNPAEKAAAIAAGRGKKNYYENQPPKYKCRICDKMCHKPSQLRSHELTHVDSEFRKDHKCPYCEKKYTSVHAMNSHVSKFHETLNTRRKLCRVCGLLVFHKDLKHHMRSHQKYKCRVCEKSFVNQGRLSAHEEKCGKPIPGREQYQFECDICLKRFSTRRLWSDHRRRTHKTHWKTRTSLNPRKCDVTVINPEEGDHSLEDLNNEGIQHVQGNIYCYQLYQLERRISSHGIGFKCLTCSEELEMEEVEENEDALEERVKEHVRSRHMGSFQCNKCTKRVKTLFEMEAHHRLEHLNLKGFSCDICGRTAIPLKTIKKHLWSHKSIWDFMEAVNAGEHVPVGTSYTEVEKRLKEMGVEVEVNCVLCGKRDFEKVEDLYTHRRQAHPDAPVVKMKYTEKIPAEKKKCNRKKGPAVDCPECGKTYPYLYSMQLHMYKVHKKWVKSSTFLECKRKRRKIKVIAEEDLDEENVEENEEENAEENNVEENYQEENAEENLQEYAEENTEIEIKTMDCFDRVEIKKEVVSTDNEDIQHVHDNIYSYQMYKLERRTGSHGKSYKCLTCSEAFEIKKMNDDDHALEERVKEHIRSRHIMGSFKCDKCSKRVKTSFEMEAHHRMEHLNLKVFSCDICGRTAIPLKSIKIHLWSHKSVFDFVEAVNAGEHVPVGTNYSEKMRLLKEMGVEVDVKCTLCGKRDFEKVEDLYIHRRQDHSDAPVVKMKWKEKASRKKKDRKSGPPVDCPECGKTYPYLYSMQLHMYRVHKKWVKSKTFLESGRKRRIFKVVAEEDVGEESATCSKGFQAAESSQ